MAADPDVVVVVKPVGGGGGQSRGANAGENRTSGCTLHLQRERGAAAPTARRPSNLAQPDCRRDGE